MLKRLVDVRDDEVTALLVSFFCFFALMAGYFILRPIRDEMAVSLGTDRLPWLFAATLVSMLVLAPIYAALVARIPRPRLIPIVYRFFLLNLLAFYASWKLGLAPGWTERVYYVWVSVFNVFVVSVFWSFMADTWTSEQGKRLFGFIAAGGSLGSILGSSSVLALVKPIGTTALLLLSAALLEAAARMVKVLARRAHAGSPQPVGGGFLDGFWHAVRSPYLFGIVMLTFLFTITSTYLYYVQTDVMKGFGDSAARTQFYSAQDLIINAAAAFLQASLTGRLVKRLGIAGAQVLTPLVTIAGFAAIYFWRGVWVVAAVFVVRRIAHFAFDRPSKEMLFTTVSRDDRYKTKNLIDTAIYRTGDQLGSWSYGPLGAFLVPLAIPLAAAWLAISLALAKSFDRRTHAVEGASS